MSYTTKLDAYLRSTNTSKTGDASKSLILESAKLGNYPFGEDDHHIHNHSRQYYQSESAAVDWSHNISVVHPTEKSKKESSFFSTNENHKKETRNDDSFTCKPQNQVIVTKGIKDKSKLDTFGIADMSIQGNIPHEDDNTQAISPFQQEKIIQSLLHKLVNIANEQTNNRTSGIKDTASSETKPSHYDLNQFRPKKLITQFSQQSPGSTKSTQGVESQDYNLESFLPQKRFLKLSRESTYSSNHKNELDELAAAVVKQLKEQNLLLSCDFQQSQAISQKQNSTSSQQFTDPLMKSKRERLSTVTLPTISIVMKNPVRIVSEAQTQTCEELKQSKIQQPSQHQIFLMQQQYQQQQMQARMNQGGGGWNNHGSRRSSTNTNNQNTLQQHPGFEYELESELLSEEILHSHGNTPGAMFSAQAFHQNSFLQNQQVFMNRPPTYQAQQNYSQSDEQKLLAQRQKLQQLEIERRLLDEEFMKKQATRHMAGGSEQEGEFDTILRLDQIPFPNISLSRKDSFVAGSNYKSEHLCPDNSLAHLSASQSSQQCNHSTSQSRNPQNLIGRGNMQQQIQHQVIINNQNASFHEIQKQQQKQQPQLQHLQDEQYQDYQSESNYHEDGNYNQMDYDSQFSKENNQKEESEEQPQQYEDNQRVYEERDEQLDQEEDGDGEGEWSDQKYNINHRNEQKQNYQQGQNIHKNVPRDSLGQLENNNEIKQMNFKKKLSNSFKEKAENQHFNEELLIYNQKLLNNGTNQSNSSFNFSGKQSLHGTLNGTGKVSLGGTGENFTYFKTFGQAGKGTSSTAKSKETAAIMFTQQSETNNQLKLSAAQFERKLLLIQAFFRYCWIYKREQFKTAFKSALVSYSDNHNEDINDKQKTIEYQEEEEVDSVEECQMQNNIINNNGNYQNINKNTQNLSEIPSKITNNNNVDIQSNNNISSRSNLNNAQTSSRMRTLQQGNNFGESRLSYALTASPLSAENSSRSEKQLSSRNSQPTTTTQKQAEEILTESLERRNIPIQPGREPQLRDNLTRKDRPSPSRLSENKLNSQSSSQGFRSQYPQESFLIPFTHIKNLKQLVETALCS